MQTCKKCGFTDLVWKKYYGKWKLWDTKTKKFHFESCQMSQEEYKEYRQGDVCKHRISTDRYCPKCYDEEHRNY
jgi:hypothetical protein